MPAGFRVPEWVNLPDELLLRGWSRSDLAQHAGISIQTACNAVDGLAIRASTGRKILAALAGQPVDETLAEYRRSA